MRIHATGGHAAAGGARRGASAPDPRTDGTVEVWCHPGAGSFAPSPRTARRKPPYT